MKNISWQYLKPLSPLYSLVPTCGLYTRYGQYGTGCPDQLEPVGFFQFGLIPEEKMFGVLRLEH